MAKHSKQFVRSLKNITNGYSSVQIQVRNATSNDSWGPTSAEMNEIALLTYHDRYIDDIITILERRLNDKGKNWRHVMKALTLLLYCVYEGSDAITDWLRKNLHLVTTLREFTYADARNIDQGGPIRTKATVLTELLQDETKLMNEKQNYQRIRQQMGRPGIVDFNTSTSTTTDTSSHGRLTLDLPPPTTPNSMVRPKSSRQSLEGRYSLSLQTPLQSIQEDSNELVQIASREVLDLNMSK
jgi:hypothetical protein